MYEPDTTQTQAKLVTATATFFGLCLTRRQLNNKHNINLLSHIWRKHVNMNTNRAMLLAL